MANAHESTHAAAGESDQPTAADAVSDPSTVSMNDAAGGPTADKEQDDNPSHDEAAAQLGDFA